MDLFRIENGRLRLAGAAELHTDQIIVQLAAIDEKIAALQAERESWLLLLEQSTLGLPEGHG